MAVFRYRVKSELKDPEWIERSRHEIKENNDNVWRMQPKSNVVRLYIKRKEEGRGLMSVQQRVTEEENSVGCYSASPQENLIRGVAAA